MNATALAAFAHRRTGLMLALLVLAGVMLRVAWVVTAHGSIPSLVSGEANNVAIAFSRTGAIADAFRPGQGPTAHVMPVTPVIAGSVYRVLGIATPASDAVLTGWSLALVFGSFGLLFAAFGQLAMPRIARIAAFAFLALAPLNLNLEAGAFRIWEGGLAAFGGALCLWQLLRLDAKSALTIPDVAITAALAAATLFVSPPMGVAAYVGGALLMIRRVPARRWAGHAAIIAVITAALLTPWLARNIDTMGRPILLRDNFGLEASQAFHDGAVDPADPWAAFRERHRQVHPYADHSGTVYAAMVAAGGEAAYSEGLARETNAWIAAHPLAFARLAARHIGEMLFPPSWYWSMFGRSGQGTMVKLGLNWAISLLGIAGLVAGLRLGGMRYAYAACFLVSPLLVYMMVQPTLRYRYLIFALLVFLAFDLLGRAWRQRTA